MADILAVDYDLQLASGGHVQLRISCDFRQTSVPDQEFLLAVLDKVAGFARLAAPATEELPVPSVLTGRLAAARGGQAMMLLLDLPSGVWEHYRGHLYQRAA